MPSLSPSLYAAALLCLAGAAPAAPLASPDTLVAAHAADQVQPEATHAVPEPETPFQVIAFAGLLLIWRNRRRVVAG